MGTVSVNIKCPRCKEDGCNNEFNYKTGEEYINCSQCGYYYSFTYRRDKEGNFVKKDSAKGDTLDNFISDETLIEKAFGAYKLVIKNGGWSHGTIADEKEFQDLLDAFKKMDKSEVESFSVSRLIEGKIYAFSLYNDNASIEG